MVVRNVHRGLVDQKRQGIVGHQAVVGEDESERLDIGADDGHGCLRESWNRRVGKGASATCPPSALRKQWWARFALPTLQIYIFKPPSAPHVPFGISKTRHV